MAKSGKQSFALLSGVVLGGGLMYLLDPDRGNRRRKMARDKMIRGLHVVSDGADKGVRDLRNRARGSVAEAWSALRQERVGDDVLEQRVRSRLGRLVSHPNAIEVSVANGTVSLRGPVLEHEADELLTNVWRLRRVSGVENHLEVHREPGDVPGLQGGSGHRRDLFQENWAPATRLLAGTGGVLLLAAAPRRRGWLLRIAGTTLLLRAATNLSLRRLFGLGETRAGIRLQRTIELNAPVARVYELWSNPENWPEFMEHVREVRKSGEGTYHWVVAGPAGVSVSFDSQITQQVPNQVVAWKSLPGQAVRNAGIVRFQEANGGTRLHILMSYNPPAGVLGHVVAALFGSDPARALENDLVRLKSLLESGKTTAHGKKVTRGQRGA